MSSDSLRFRDAARIPQNVNGHHTGMNMDISADDASDGRWMTYAELGLAREISKGSALKLALRQKWRKQKDNHGHVRM
jgi:hypothetical protein